VEGGVTADVGVVGLVGEREGVKVAVGLGVDVGGKGKEVDEGVKVGDIDSVRVGNGVSVGGEVGVAARVGVGVPSRAIAVGPVLTLSHNCQTPRYPNNKIKPRKRRTARMAGSLLIINHPICRITGQSSTNLKPPWSIIFTRKIINP
jgi:hypothetical protein